MEIFLNGQKRKIGGGLVLRGLVEEIVRDSGMVIAEVNGEIVKRTDWDARRVEDGDVIELLRFVGGGNYENQY